jgi:hypothetical protein
MSAGRHGVAEPRGYHAELEREHEWGNTWVLRHNGDIIGEIGLVRHGIPHEASAITRILDALNQRPSDRGWPGWTPPPPARPPCTWGDIGHNHHGLPAHVHEPGVAGVIDCPFSGLIPRLRRPDAFHQFPESYEVTFPTTNPGDTPT